jgi:protein O-GlcNAc transferase
MQLQPPSKRRKKRDLRSTVLYAVAVLLLLFAASRRVPWFNPVTPTPTPTRSAQSYRQEALILYSLGDVTGALVAYGKALELSPTDADLITSRAELLVLRERFDEAIAACDGVLALNAEDSQALATKAQALDWQGKPGEALEYARDAVEADSRNAFAFAILAEVYADLGSPLARDTAQRAIELAPDSAIAHRNLGYALERLGLYDAAMAQYDEAIRLEPNLFVYYLNIGFTDMAMSDLNAAIESFRAAAQKDPHSAMALDALGWAYVNAGDAESAIETLQLAVAEDPSHARAQAHLGAAYYADLNYEKAIPYLGRAIELGAGDAVTYTQLGLSLAYTEQCAEALVYLDQALGLDPGSQGAQNGLAICQQ